MKIASVRADVYSHRFDGVAVTQGVGQMVKRDLVLVRVTAEDGTVGYGEAHHGLNPTAVAEVINHSMAPLAVGVDALAIEDVWERISRHQIVTHGVRGAGSVIALSGIDIALWDLRGTLLRTPVFRLLGGTRRKIRAYAGGMGLGWQPDTELEREVGRRMKPGRSAIKLRVGQELGADASRVRHIRKAFGLELDIAVDAVTRYLRADMRRVIRYREDNEVMWLEEPFTPENAAVYAELRRVTEIPIAAGENHYTKHMFRDLLSAGASTSCRPIARRPGVSPRLRRSPTWRRPGISVWRLTPVRA